MNVAGKPAVRKELFVVIAVFLIPPIVLRGGTTITLSLTRVVLEILSSAFQIIIVSAVARRTDGTPARDFGLSPPRLRDVGAGVVSAVVIGVAAVAYLSLAPGSTHAIAVTTDNAARGVTVALAVTVAIAAAYREEFLYRVYLVRRFAALGYPGIAALAFGAIVFGAAHLSQGIAAAVYATVVGAALGVIFVVTGSLHGPAIAHAVYNVSVILRLVPGAW